MDIEEIVALSVKHNAGDLHLCSGHYPFWRCNGRLELIEAEGEGVVTGKLCLALAEHSTKSWRAAGRWIFP
ncbi:4-diphosphocytidyl-2-C-methyl-D-erythritol kinase domain protein [Candidatus Erwinia dacicola]|uniref:4-diphosphocytidyl-2-C-methyl-D-erythritol kinase domain protein n=1 Tax=Candidatus Erwinia dacicola TaxID=252393 RepID=A0A328TTG2_9GAMM|nr:4-diphosphocytidyl-2-C-methyl-D-erythritol kinase domain protein [Candidatus Erwinia dacicola]